MKKMGKKAMVSRHDYDVYSIHLPFSMIRSRRRSAFVRRELEKRHPRFSEKCCTDTKLAFHKGKLTADIAVMDKVRLAEYKKDFPGKRLVLEEHPDRSVFKPSANTKRAVVFSLLALAAVCGARTVRHLRPSPEVTALPVETETKSALVSPAQLLATVLAAVSRKGGRLSAVEWQGGSCSFAISGCHPEDVASHERCVVSYKNNEPHFDLALNVAPLSVVQKNAAAATEFVPALRHALLEYGVAILSEQIAQNEVTVQAFAAHDVLAAALKICTEQAELHGWTEKAFSLRGGENGCDAQITLTAGTVFYEELSPLQTVATYAPLLVPASAVPLVVRPRAVSYEKPPVIARDKIGEIRRMDGTSFIYYRLSDGQIVCERTKTEGAL